MSDRKRKLRVLVITMGSERQQHIESLFAHPSMSEHFEKPAFSPGVPSRTLRNRYEFLRVANEVGILPEQEWEAIRKAKAEGLHDTHFTERFFDCLEGIPVTEGRRGSSCDVALHYSRELWQKAKSLNRGRAVIGCTFAHLIALKKLVSESFDLILEDNVRAPVESCAERIWESMAASQEWSEEGNGECHLRLIGWLGSIPNLKWILQTHAKKRSYARTNRNQEDSPGISIFPFPLAEHLEVDLDEMQEDQNEDKNDEDKQGDEIEDEEAGSSDDKRTHKTPGGNPVWGAYAYWMSSHAYESLMETLRNDVGALLWKGKRMKHYLVKPIDKILPRRVMSSFGASSVHVSTHPAFFRAPMLTSKIHTQWDPEFCKSTEYQLQHGGLDWSDLWLSSTEREIVKHRQSNGEWLTIAGLELSRAREESGGVVAT